MILQYKSPDGKKHSTGNPVRRNKNIINIIVIPCMALQKKRSGWDCFRHYEIIASGTFPFFIDLNHLPTGTMHTFPVSLVQKAMTLPGVPSMDEVKRAIQHHSSIPKINHKIFPSNIYCRLRTELLKYARSRLTTVQTALHVTQGKKRVLMVTPWVVDYQSVVLAHGLEILATDNHIQVDFLTDTYHTRKPILYKDHITDHSYGYGFTYQGRLPTPIDFLTGESEHTVNRRRRNAIIHRLNMKYYDLLIVTNGANKYCNFGLSGFPFKDLLMLNNFIDNSSARVVTVDGSDINGCHHPFETQLKRIDTRYIREYNLNSPLGKEIP